jgi:hypothetical protein
MSTPDRVQGQKTDVASYEHPHWLDGTPILVGQDVETIDGWRGFVSSVSCEEVTVMAYGESEHYEEFSPDDLTRIPMRPQVVS